MNTSTHRPSSPAPALGSRTASPAGMGPQASVSQEKRRDGMFAAIALAIVGVVAAALLPRPVEAGSFPVETAIYGIAGDNNIYSIDPATGAVSGTVSTASLLLTGSTANAFALDRDRAQIYFLDSSKNLYYWALASGTGGQIATATQLGLDTAAIPRNATYFDGKFWFIGENDTSLRSASIILDGITGLPTGATLETPITIEGVTGSLNPNDIAYDPISDSIYGSDLSNAFFQIPVSTRLSGTVSYSQLYNPGLGVQLAYDQDYATLYGMDFSTGQWYTMSTTVSGSATAIPAAVTQSEFLMRDLAGGLAPVPEPGTMALAGSGVAIAGVMVYRGRHRRRRTACGWDSV